MNSPALPAQNRSAASAHAPTVDELQARLDLLSEVLTGRRDDLLRLAAEKPRNEHFASGLAWGIGALERAQRALQGNTDPAAICFQSITP